MARQSQQEDLRQRPLTPKEAEAKPDAGNNVVSRPAAMTTTNVSLKRGRDRGAMAKRGIGSLLVTVSLPLSLTLSAIYLFGHRRVVPDHLPHPSPPWYLPLWMMNGVSIVSSFLMGLSAWLVRAKGGFHRNPRALPLNLRIFIVRRFPEHLLQDSPELLLHQETDRQLLGSARGSHHHYHNHGPNHACPGLDLL